MTTVSRHGYIATSLLALLSLTPSVSLGQMKPAELLKPIQADAQVKPDLLLSLPDSDALITIDVKRLLSEVLPRLLADEPALRPLVLSLVDLKVLTGLDPKAIERLAIGIHYAKPGNATSDSDFTVVAIAQSSEAARLPAMMRQTKFLEQPYGGKNLFIEQAAGVEPNKDFNELPIAGHDGFAITTLNETTIVLGDVAEVRACIDLNNGKGKGVSPELIAGWKRSPKALISAATLLPSSVIPLAEQMGGSDVSQTIASLKWIYASVEPSAVGFELAVTIPAASPEQAKSLADVLAAVRTLSNSFAGGKTTRQRIIRELMRGMLVATEKNEIQVRDVVTQATLNTLAKVMASDAYIGRGHAQMTNDDPDGAIVEYDRAILLNADEPLAFLNRGKAKSDKGDLDSAIADYDKAISLDPNWSLPYNNRGFNHLNKGEFDAAIVDLDKAIALNPNDAYAHNNRGKAYAGKGDLEKAMVDYDRSIALDASNALAFNNRGFARGEKGEFDGALADYDRAITLSPKMADAYNGRGVLRYTRYSQTGSDQDLDQAIDDYNRAISLDPDDATPYYNRGYALTDKEQFNLAIADFDKSIALDPKLAGAYGGRGRARFLKAEFEQAIADLDRAIELDPTSATLYGNRGLSRLALRLDEQAGQDFKKCYELDESMRVAYEPIIKEVKKTRRAKPRR